MLLELHSHHKAREKNISVGFIWEEFDFDICKNQEGGRYTWAFFTLLCFPASCSILWDIFQARRREVSLTPNDFLILNLSIMDTIFLASLPPGILNHLIWKNWAFEALWNGLYALNTCGRPLMMACNCIDCYLAVVHPITYHKTKSLVPRVVLAGIVWTLTVGNGIVFFLFYRMYFSFFPAVTFIIAIVIIFVCDGFIVHTLIKSDPGRNTIHPQKQRAIQILVYSLATTVFSYLPPVVLFLIGRPLSSSFNMFVCTLALPISITSTLGSAIMPMLYLYNTGKLGCFRVGCFRS